MSFVSNKVGASFIVNYVGFIRELLLEMCQSAEISLKSILLCMCKFERERDKRVGMYQWKPEDNVVCIL